MTFTWLAVQATEGALDEMTSGHPLRFGLPQNRNVAVAVCPAGTSVRLSVTRDGVVGTAVKTVDALLVPHVAVIVTGVGSQTGSAL
jgi:hypothetical protein